MGENIYTIISKKLAGTASPEELSELQTWLSADPAHPLELSELEAFWQASEFLYADRVFDTEAAWSRVEAATIGAPKARTIAFPSWLRSGLAAAAVLAVGFFGFRWYQSSRSFTVLADANREVVLPDHSQVFLKKGATLRYPAHFAANARTVRLSGEAFFEVQPNAAAPFTIEGEQAAVQVLGTSFDFNSTVSGSSVAVRTGKVRFSSVKDPGAQLVLTPGQSGRFDREKLIQEDISSDNYLYWKTGLLTFRDQPFSGVIGELGRQRQVKVAFDPSVGADIRQQRINASFQGQGTEEMLNELCLITHCKWNKTGDSYTVSVK